MGDLRKRFARRLKKLRQERGMTQQELSDASGLSIGFVRSIEQGVHAPSFESLVSISNALGTTVAELFDFGGES